MFFNGEAAMYLMGTWAIGYARAREDFIGKMACFPFPAVEGGKGDPAVVLGGMIGEKVRKWKDKVPILGDVPVLGKFFRSSGEKSEKTNLLIFVTARLVNPAGLPIRANEVRGLPDFRR